MTINFNTLIVFLENSLKRFVKFIQFLFIQGIPLQIDDASVKKISAPNEVETTMRTHANISSASKNDINASLTSSSVQPILTTT
jgi:hypothetical protein